MATYFQSSSAAALHKNMSLYTRTCHFTQEHVTLHKNMSLSQCWKIRPFASPQTTEIRHCNQKKIDNLPGVANLNKFVFLCSLFLLVLSLFLWYIHLFYRALFAKEAYNFKEPTNRSHPTTQLGWWLLSQKNMSEEPEQKDVYANLRTTSTHRLRQKSTSLEPCSIGFFRQKIPWSKRMAIYYGVAMTSRLLKIIGLSCKRAL